MSARAGRAWNGSWTGNASRVCVVCNPSACGVLSVQLGRLRWGVVGMVRRRSTVQFRRLHLASDQVLPYSVWRREGLARSVILISEMVCLCRRRALAEQAI